MMSGQFDSDSFKKFLGDPIEVNWAWGRERRYRIDKKRLEAYRSQLKVTVRHHHSSFEYAEELEKLGFPQTARVMIAQRAGLPSSHETQMGNFGEVISSEYGRRILDFETTFVFPKRFNPNVDQSMKGVDILGIRGAYKNPALLLGEAKCHQRFSKQSINHSHTHLVSLWQQDIPKLLAFSKEILRLEGDKEGEAKLDRFCSQAQMQQFTLVFIITQDTPQDPFESFDTLLSESPLPNLLAVHVQVERLIDWMPIIFTTE
jgi:hypothetical protein